MNWELKVIEQFQGVQNNGLVQQLTEWSKSVVQFQQSGALTGEQASEINGLMQEYNALQNRHI